MAEASDRYRIFYENLVDAGCSKNIADKCLLLIKKGDKEGILNLLASQRVTILKKIHIGQKQIDCLDFLIYKIKKEL